jgi:hypothetical protein
MKKRIRRGDPQRRTYWEAVVRRWKESGQSVRAFCRAEHLRETAFYFWRRELAQRGPAPAFLPVQVVESACQRRGAAELPCGVEIVLAQGRTVRVQAGFDRQTLANVLAVLEARPC